MAPDASDSFNNRPHSGTLTQTVNKAAAAITVTGYFAEYDGGAHRATGTAIGVRGGPERPGLNLGATFTNVADNIDDLDVHRWNQLQRPDRHGPDQDRQDRSDPHCDRVQYCLLRDATGPSGTPQGLFQDNSPPVPIRDYGTVLDLSPTGIGNNNAGMSGDGFRYVNTVLSGPGRDGHGDWRADHRQWPLFLGLPADAESQYGIVNAYYVTYEEAGATGNWWVGRLIDNDRVALGA